MTSRLQAAIWLVATALSGSVAATPGPTEQEVKAAMLYNFLKFVEWPPGPQSSPNSPLVVGISGSDAFASVMARTVADRTVQGRPVIVRQTAGVREMQACNAVFIAGNDPVRSGAALEGLRRSAVLTVGEMPGFARLGGMIGFVVVDKRTIFEINVDASARAGLTVSSKLLRLASVVKEKK